MRSSIVQTHRDAWVEINLGNIEHNITQIKDFLPENVDIMAVVKADAYGHGAQMITPTLLASGVKMLGVASIDEGIELRKSGITAPILVLGAAPSWAISSAVENDIMLSVFSSEQLKACEIFYNRFKIKAKVHIKIDTGMNRIGVPVFLADDFLEYIFKQDYIDVKGLFTHFACAEDEAITKTQYNKFEEAISKYRNKDVVFHCANTSAAFSYPQIYEDMVRVGIGIYGLFPELKNNPELDLKPAMGLKGRVVNIHFAKEAEGVSYGFSFKSIKNTKIATIPIGYADGIDRRLSNEIYGFINGKLVKQIGNITMDQMMFDVSEIVDISEGDIITILSDDDKKLSVDNWADILGTINYELICRLKARLPRVYTR